jgi:TRAP-type mannitol/chloroaromatic compound transport system permease large subunit
MESFNIKVIISGMALLLFGIIIAIMSKNPVAYVIGGLGLLFVFTGCFAKDDYNSKTK